MPASPLVLVSCPLFSQACNHDPAWLPSLPALASSLDPAALSEIHRPGRRCLPQRKPWPGETTVRRSRVQGDILELVLWPSQRVSAGCKRQSIVSDRRKNHSTHLDERPDLHPLLVPLHLPLLTPPLQPLPLPLHDVAPPYPVRERAGREDLVRGEVVEEGGRDADLRARGGRGGGEAGLEGCEGGGCADDFVVS